MTPAGMRMRRLSEIIREKDNLRVEIEKLFDQVRDMLGGILDPSTLGELREAAFLTHRLEEVRGLYEALMLVKRQGEHALLSGKQDEEIVQLYEAFWEAYGERILSVYEQLIEKWESHREAGEKLDYFG